jgi:hypothetical protein
MEQLGTQLGAALTDLRQAVEKSAQEPRSYKKTSDNVYKPEQARFKLVVWFHDGNRRTYYSYDNAYQGKTSHLDEYEGIMKLLRLTKQYAGKFKNAMIFLSLSILVIFKRLINLIYLTFLLINALMMSSKGMVEKISIQKLKLKK